MMFHTKKGAVRAKVKMNYWLIEEDPQSWDKTKVRQVSGDERENS